jgi:hypothetical protein
MSTTGSSGLAATLGILSLERLSKTFSVDILGDLVAIDGFGTERVCLGPTLAFAGSEKFETSKSTTGSSGLASLLGESSIETAIESVSVDILGDLVEIDGFGTEGVSLGLALAFFFSSRRDPSATALIPVVLLSV